MSKYTKTATTLKDILEDSVKQIWQHKLNSIFEELSAEFRAKLEARIEDCRIDVKKQANVFALELLQKAESSGITVEFKL